MAVTWRLDSCAAGTSKWNGKAPPRPKLTCTLACSNRLSASAGFASFKSLRSTPSSASSRRSVGHRCTTSGRCIAASARTSASKTCGLRWALPPRLPSGKRTASTLPLCCNRPSAWREIISALSAAQSCGSTLASDTQRPRSSSAPAAPAQSARHSRGRGPSPAGSVDGRAAAPSSLPSLVEAWASVPSTAAMDAVRAQREPGATRGRT
mmetsp:Transcript_92794/g.294443  ORF Transcript_92794/g.294443 Transcript_92794/m.294443 type:complete len:209 (-) Transcript_92794:1-627(-)